MAAPRKRDKDVQTDAYDSAFSVHRHIESAAGKLLEGAGECYARGHDEAAALLRDLAHEPPGSTSCPDAIPSRCCTLTERPQQRGVADAGHAPPA